LQPNQQPKESLIGAALNAAMKDGTLAAAWRQGLGELGQALKAFPDSIQHHELGTIGSPTPGEIAQGRGAFGTGADQEPHSLTEQIRAAAEHNEGQEPHRGMERGGR
jgi:hypothetical protein